MSLMPKLFTYNPCVAGRYFLLWPRKPLFSKNDVCCKSLTNRHAKARKRKKCKNGELFLGNTKAQKHENARTGNYFAKKCKTQKCENANKNENKKPPKHETPTRENPKTRKLTRKFIVNMETLRAGVSYQYFYTWLSLPKKTSIKSGTLTERVVSVHDMCTHVCVYLYLHIYTYTCLLSRHEYAMHFLLDFLDWPNPSNWGGGGSYLASWCPGHFQGEVFAFQSTWLSSFGLNTEERCTAGQIMKNMMKQCWVTGWHVSIDITIDIQVLKIRVDFIWSLHAGAPRCCSHGPAIPTHWSRPLVDLVNDGRRLG